MTCSTGVSSSSILPTGSVHPTPRCRHSSRRRLLLHSSAPKQSGSGLAVSDGADSTPPRKSSASLATFRRSASWHFLCITISTQGSRLAHIIEQHVPPPSPLSRCQRRTTCRRTTCPPHHSTNSLWRLSHSRPDPVRWVVRRSPPDKVGAGSQADGHPCHHGGPPRRSVFLVVSRRPAPVDGPRHPPLVKAEASCLTLALPSHLSPCSGHLTGVLDSNARWISHQIAMPYKTVAPLSRLSLLEDR
jgi:hypothetical protein